MVVYKGVLDSKCLGKLLQYVFFFPREFWVCMNDLMPHLENAQSSNDLHFESPLNDSLTYVHGLPKRYTKRYTVMLKGLSSVCVQDLQ